jgi:hypothetical protein
MRNNREDDGDNEDETVMEDEDFDESTAEFVPPELLGLTRRNNGL